MGKLFQNKKFQNAMFFFATLTSIIYLLWRAIFTLPFQSGIVAIIFGIMLLVSEIHPRSAHLNSTIERVVPTRSI